MPRIPKTPKLKGAKIKISKTLGLGQGGEILSDPVRRAIITETGSKRKKYAAVKTQSRIQEKDRRKILAEGQRAWKTFYKAGLPVPKFSKVITDKNSEHYLSIFMEDMTKKYGRLEETHEAGMPTYFHTLSIKKNSSLIKNLGKDLATIHNTNFSTRHLDFWHFYKNRSGKLNRVILDFGDFQIHKDQRIVRTQMRHNINHAKKYFGRREFMLFFKEYLKHYKGPHREIAIESSRLTY